MRPLQTSAPSNDDVGENVVEFQGVGEIKNKREMNEKDSEEEREIG